MFVCLISNGFFKQKYLVKKRNFQKIFKGHHNEALEAGWWWGFPSPRGHRPASSSPPGYHQAGLPPAPRPDIRLSAPPRPGPSQSQPKSIKFLYCFILWGYPYTSVFQARQANIHMNYICTVGAQSIARLCQNLVNCRGNISAHRRRRSCGFFYSKDLRLESELKF